MYKHKNRNNCKSSIPNSDNILSTIHTSLHHELLCKQANKNFLTKSLLPKVARLQIIRVTQQVDWNPPVIKTNL